MALQLPTAITFETTLKGQGLDQLKRQLQGLSAQTTRTSKTLDVLYNDTRKLAAAAGNSISSLNRQIAAMKNLRDEAQIGSRQFKFYTAELQRLERQQAKLTGAGAPSGGLMQAIGGLRGGLAGAAAVAGAFGVSNVIGGIANSSMQAETARVRLRALTDVYGEYNAAQEASNRIARTLRLSNAEATDSFAKLYAGLRPTGVGLKELEQIFVGFNAAARTSGATAEETSAAMIQLKQALVSGRAQGDELRSILEQAPALGQAVADAMTKTGEFGKVTRAQLKELGSEGKISTDVLITALKQLGEKELPKLDKMFNTGQQALTDLNNELKNFGDEIGKAFGPIAVGLIQGLTAVVHKLANEFAWLNKQRADAGVRIAANEKAFQQALKETGGTGLLSFTDPKFRARYDQLRSQYLTEAQQAANPGVTQDQLNARQEAADNRKAARDAAGAADRKKLLEDEIKIRVDAERKLAEYRLERLREAQELERRLGDQRLDLERSTAEARRRIQQQQADFATEAERQRLRGSGLGTEALDTQARLNEATRRFTEQKIKIEQDASDRQIQLERTLEEFKLETARGVSAILQDAGDKLADKMMKGAQGAASALTGGGGMAGGIIARTGNTGQSTGPHLDIRWADGRPITKADADKYFSLNGRSPSSYGVTSGYGRRALFGRSFHAGMDFGTPAGTPISLKGGASFLRDLGFTGAGGYAVEIMTPQGPMRLLHLQAGSAAKGMAGGTALPALPGLEAARGRLSQAIDANAAAQGTAAAGELLGSRQAEFGNITQELDAQRKSTGDQLRDYERMLQLQRGGLSPELAKQRVEAENAARAETTKLTTLRDQLVQDREIAGLTDQQKQTLDGLIQGVDDRLAKQKDIVAAVNAETEAYQRLQQQQEQIKQLSDGIANSIGNGIGQAFDLVLRGTEDWGNELRDIAANVLRDIANQLLQIMVIQPLVKGISTGLTGLFSANGNVFDQRGYVPFAMGGVVNRPTIFPFANGAGFSMGVMGEAGPEAILPLRRGSNGKLGVQAEGGGTSVVVNVDATGSSVQGNAGQGQQLGRVVAAAVQAELVKQRRPGGLLAA